MKKLTILIVLALLCPFFYAQAQSISNNKPLKVGDTIPDIVINKVVNYKSKTIRLADFKDKLVILDFWATYCVPCIWHMPLVYDIQKKHADVFMLLVNSKFTKNKPDEIQRFFEKRKSAFNLPSVILDTLLHDLLQPPSLGTYYWIRNGVLLAITTGSEVTEDKVNKMLVNQNILHQHTSYKFDWQKPVFFDDNGGPQKQPYIFRSILFPYTEGVKNSIGVDQNDSGEINRIYVFNSSPLKIIANAFPQYQKFLTAKLKINVKDADRLNSANTKKEVREKNLVSYEAIFPSVSRQQAWKYFQEDVTRYFPYSLDTVKLKDSCWVLKLASDSHIKLGSGKRETNLEEQTGLPIYYNNFPLLRLVMYLEEKYRTPLIDETNYTGSLNLDLPSDIKNAGLLIKMLRQQGLILSKELRESEYLVVTDRVQPK